MIEFLVPIRCAACGAAGWDLCAACLTRCAGRALLRRPSSNGVPPILALGSYDGPLRDAILALKFSHRVRVGSILGALLGSQLHQAFDALVPVPLHASRLRDRGYNQSEHIAEGIRSRLPGCLILSDALIRARPTQPQSALALSDRVQNVEAAFVAGPSCRHLSNAGALLVDDVATTGATLRSCARVLWQSGARSVTAACLALRN